MNTYNHCLPTDINSLSQNVQDTHEECIHIDVVQEEKSEEDSLRAWAIL